MSPAKRLAIPGPPLADRPLTRSTTRRLRAIEEALEEAARLGITLNTFPPEVLTVILKNIPLLELLPLRVVCRHWKELIETICRWKRTLAIRIYSKKAIWGCVSLIPCSLKAVYASDDLTRYINKRAAHTPYHLDALQIEITEVTAKLRNALAILFPNITKLTLISTLEYRPGNVNKFTMLVAAFPKSTTASFWTMMVGSPPANGAISKLAAQINVKMPDLKTLDLYIEDLYNYRARTAVAHNPIHLENILPNLERFSLSCSVANHYDVLRQLGPNLTNLSINCQFIRVEQLRDVFASESGRRLAQTVTTLRLTYVTGEDLAVAICGHFQAVSSLQIAYVTIKKAILNNGLLTALAAMPHLTALRLHDYIPNPEATRVNTQLTHLTIASFDLIARFTRLYCPSGTFNPLFFSAALAVQFPKLTHLILMCYEPLSQLHQADIYEALAKFYKDQLVSCILKFKTIEFQKFHARHSGP